MTASRAICVLGVLALAWSGSVAAADLALLCSVPSDWCQALATKFERDSGIKVSVTQRQSGDVLALLGVQSARPRYDVWYGGAGDLHLEAAEDDLTDEYRSPRLPELREWAVRHAEHARFRSVAIYLRAIGFIVNTRRLAARQLAEPKCLVDLGRPEFDDQLQMGHPSQSAATRATVIALAQVLGEQKAFELLGRIHENVALYSRRATNAARAVARGDVSLGIVFLYDGANEVAGGFPVKLIAPCEGLPYDVVGMSLIKGGSNAESARKFYDWALGAESQEIEYAFSFWQMPAQKGTRLDAKVFDTDTAKVVSYDYARYGTSAARKHLLDGWDREVGKLPR